MAMINSPHRFGAALVAAALLAGCDSFDQQPPSQPAPMPPPAEAAGPDLRESVGATYPDFVSGVGASYSPDALGLAAADRARVWRAMATASPARLIQGGGAEALVFQGCAHEGCDAGRAVVAIDLSTGGAFVGVRDVGGSDELTPNDRVEALLRLTSPTRDWDTPAASP